jgi:glycosyltransferase involved in cell wall biosynthesis
MCHENGLDILADAFILLKKQKTFDDLKLIITGGQTGDDNSYLKQIRRKLGKAGLLSSVDFHKEFEGCGRKEFFAKASVISVPVRNGEAFGIYIAESLASGIPVVQPALGAFPEVLATTGGGIIYGENNPEGLASALKQLLNDPVRLMNLSEEARKGAEQHLNIHSLAMDMIGVYRQVTARS